MSTTSHLDHMELSERVQERLAHGELTSNQVDDFRDFLSQVDRDIFRHPVVISNAYTRWFRHGEATDQELCHFVRQFSVFSNQFLVAALERVINAPNLAQSRAAKEILLNELGVIYRKPGATAAEVADKDREGDPELVSTEGTVDGGTYRFRAAHFEWLLAVGQGLGLGYDDLGKRRNGRPSTLKFCDELRRLFGHEDGQVAAGASFAVENWAAAGFWQELEDGLMKIKQDRLPSLRLAFFTWHNRVEAQHASHVLEEIEEAYFAPEFSRHQFFRGARQALDAIAVFWNGLEEDRLAGIVN